MADRRNNLTEAEERALNDWVRQSYNTSGGSGLDRMLDPARLYRPKPRFRPCPQNLALIAKSSREELQTISGEAARIREASAVAHMVAAIAAHLIYNVQVAQLAEAA